MNTEYLIALLQTGYKTIGVKFKHGDKGLSDKTYTYKCPASIKLEVEDECIVDSPYGGMQVVVVDRIDDSATIDPNKPFNYRWVVQKVDTSAYLSKLETEAAMKKKLEKMSSMAARNTAMSYLTELFGGTAEGNKEVQEFLSMCNAEGETDGDKT